MVQYESDDLSPTLADLARIERKEALEEGSELATKNFALTLLREDFKVEYIAKLTKLTVAEVKKLKNMICDQNN